MESLQKEECNTRHHEMWSEKKIVDVCVCAFRFFLGKYVWQRFP